MTTCILLAGGLGTRLRAAVPGVPKCLAPVAGTTFLQTQIQHLSGQGIERFVLSLGYLAQQVIEVATELRKSFRVEWVVERTALGTGGAALFAMYHTGLEEALVANADTFLDGDLSALLSPLDSRRGERIRMGVVESPSTARFGGVAVEGGKIVRFLSRGERGPGLINAGIYRIHRSAFAEYRPGQAFSLEADVVERRTRKGEVWAVAFAGGFADIGVGEDYRQFCEQFTACR